MTFEIAGKELATEVMDHHGLVAAVCRDLRIVERINERIGSNDPRRVIQPGTATIAMIMNGLGFTNRTLYLTPHFFKNKPIERLFGENISADTLDDHALGKALDEIADYGASKLFGEIAFEIGVAEGLIGKTAHLDTTSFSLHGTYEKEEPEVIEVTQGYSKDHRPDLKQVVLSLVMTGPANFPAWMEPQNGNSSDKKSFHETIARVREFVTNLKENNDFRWVADSALYTPEKLLACDNLKWISRVPENIKSCKGLLELPDNNFQWTEAEGGYKITETVSNHGDITQRWILIYSEQAYNREKKTFAKKLVRKKEELEKTCWHLGNQVFECQEDAEKAVKALQKKHPFYQIAYKVVPIKKHAKRGRPAKDAHRTIAGYQVQLTIAQNKAVIEKHYLRKGRFVLATNDLDREALPAKEILKEYKAQQSVEGGFRFLKDPWFMLDSFYLKKRSRIEALMMVMTLSLLIYNYAEYRIRQTLKARQETVPNQKNKPTETPTMRWIFQLMQGVALVKFYDTVGKIYRLVIANLDPVRRKIIELMGKSACNIYGIQKNFAGI